MNHHNRINRRRFMQYSALGALAAVAPVRVWAATGGEKSKATATFKADIELAITASRIAIPIHAQGAKTYSYQYRAKLLKGPSETLGPIKNSYLGPTLNFVKGQKVRIYFNNALTEPSIIHWHGLHVPQKSDGHPMYAIGQGEQYVYEFEVMNRAGTNFYHSHTHEMTASQVYKGLAGLITVTDEHEQALDLPTGDYDLPLVIQDRTFNSQNQFQYVRGMHSRMMGFLGDQILVNGKIDSTFSVQSRAYRLRVLNGSNSRIYKLAWDDGTPLTAIGTDGGLLAQPEQRPYIMLAPAERVDLWIDFSGRPVGSQLVLRSSTFSGAMPAMAERMMGGRGGGMGRGPGGMGRMHGGRGMMGGMGMQSSRLGLGEAFPIAFFKVTEKTDVSPVLPKRLADMPRFAESATDNADHPIPIGLSMSPRLNGKSFAMHKVMDYEKVALGSFKKIRIFHRQGHGMGGGMGGGMGMMGMQMAHPIHLHGQQFQIISRDVSGMSKQHWQSVKDGFIDNGWKDTVLVLPGQEVTIIKPFQDYKGLFLYHCHNLEHEDLGMMRQFFVG